MWNDVDLNRILLSLGGGGLFCRLLAMSIKWKTFLQTREFFLVKSFPYVKHSCERKKENNRDNPSTFQCTITFSGRRIFSRTYIICELFHMTKEGICLNWNWFAIPYICYFAIKIKFWLAIFSIFSFSGVQKISSKQIFHLRLLERQGALLFHDRFYSIMNNLKMKVWSLK